MTKILLTGGAGYIGSHALVLLLDKGYDVTVLDNLSNSVQVAPGNEKPESILRVEELTGKSCEFTQTDLKDFEGLRRVFQNFGAFDAVLHFAGMKAVGESVLYPLQYYENNVTGSINLLKVMGEFGVKKIIFSSSSTVYGIPQYFPVDENHPTGNCISPYGTTKVIVEEMMRDLCNSDKEFKAIMLRYFNPIGAHPSGEIGEDPIGPPRNLIPNLAQIAVGRQERLEIFGNDYETPDGTAIRGYIHVMDLVGGHVAAMEKLSDPNFSGWKAYNLGKGGHSVLQVLSTFERVCGRKIPYKFVDRRPGDVPMTFANEFSLAEVELNWKATQTLDTMCEDSWRFQFKNPKGYISQKGLPEGQNTSDQFIIPQSYLKLIS